MSSTSLWEQISGLDKKPPSLATHKIVPGRRPVVTVAVSLCQQRSPTRGSDGVPYQVAVAANLRWVWHYRVYTAKLFFFCWGWGGLRQKFSLRKIRNQTCWVKTQEMRVCWIGSSAWSQSGQVDGWGRVIWQGDQPSNTDYWWPTVLVHSSP